MLMRDDVDILTIHTPYYQQQQRQSHSFSVHIKNEERAKVNRQWHSIAIVITYLKLVVGLNPPTTPCGSLLTYIGFLNKRINFSILIGFFSKCLNLID